MAEFVVEVVVSHNQMESPQEQKAEDALVANPKEELVPEQPNPPTDPESDKRDDPSPDAPKPEERSTDEAKAEEKKLEEKVEPKLEEPKEKEHSAQEGASGPASAAAAEGPKEDGMPEQKPVDSEHLEALEQEHDEDANEAKEHASESKTAAILPPSGPFWLNSEEVLAKGIAESEVENYRKFFLQFSHLPHAWSDRLKDQTFETEIIRLSSQEVSVLIKASRAKGAQPQLTDEDVTVLRSLEDRLSAAISKFGEAGATLRVGSCAPTDGIYLDEDPAFVAKVQEAIVAELEAEPFYENAYSGWQEKASSHKNGFKRGIDTIRKSFRRSRTPKKTLVVEENAKPVESSAEPQAGKTAGETQPTGDHTSPPSSLLEGAAQPASQLPAEGAQATQDQTVHAEVHEEKQPVPTTAATSEQQDVTGPNKEVPLELEQQTENMTLSQTVTAVIEHLEDPNFGLSLYSANENSQITPDNSKSASNENMVSADAGEVKKDEMEKPLVEDEVKPKIEKEPEIQKVSEEEQKPVEKSQDEEMVVSKPQAAGEEQHQKKIKAETTTNQVLRAFMRVMTSMLRVTTGKEAMDRILTSLDFKEELTTYQQLHQEAMIYILKFEQHFARYPDFRFRGFVHKNELCALSQLNTTAYSPLVALYKENIREMVSEFFSAHVKEPLSNYDSYALDFHVMPNKVLIGKILPLHSGIDAFMFSWRKDLTVLTGSSGPMVFRILKSSKSNSFAGLKPHWQNMLHTVHQQRSSKKSGKCVLL